MTPRRHVWPKGGSQALPTALSRLIEAHGGSILTGKRVSGLLIEDGRCTGVETADDETLLAMTLC